MHFQSVRTDMGILCQCEMLRSSQDIIIVMVKCFVRVIYNAFENKPSNASKVYVSLHENPAALLLLTHIYSRHICDRRI